MYENRLDGVQEAEHIMHRLYTSFVEVAKQDKSAPLMKNTQQVYAGMTYARGAVNEDYMDVDSHRGFLYKISVNENGRGKRIVSSFFLHIPEEIYSASVRLLPDKCNSRSNPDQRHFQDWHRYFAVLRLSVSDYREVLHSRRGLRGCLKQFHWITCFLKSLFYKYKQKWKSYTKICKNCLTNKIGIVIIRFTTKG